MTSPNRRIHDHDSRRRSFRPAPQGAGPAMGHRCPGLDYATYFIQVFAIAMLRGYTWQLPPQSFEIDWSKTPPDVKGGLRARLISN